MDDFTSSNLKRTLAQRFQVGSASEDLSAALQVDSTSAGFLLPRMTTAQREAIVSPAEGLQVFDTDVKRLFLYGAGSWRREEAESLETDLTLYVDGDTGDDGNDGLSWGTAKQTFGFLYEDEADTLPRCLNAVFLCYFRGPIRARNAKGNLYLNGFYGSGSMFFVGTLTAEETFTASAYENDPTVRNARLWVRDPTKAWTPGKWRRHFIELGHSVPYPCYANTADTLWMGFGDTQGGAYAATIYSAPEILRELVTNPGVKHTFGPSLANFVSVESCSVYVTIYNAWIDENLGTSYNQFWATSVESVVLQNVAFNGQFVFGCRQFNATGCYYNLVNYGVVQTGGAGNCIWGNCCIDSTDNTGYGFNSYESWGNAFVESLIVNQVMAITAWTGALSLARDVMIRNCEKGITLLSGICELGGYGDVPCLRFDTVGQAIVGGGELSVIPDFGAIGWDVGEEVAFGPNDIGTLADLTAGTLASRVHLRVNYSDADYYSVPQDEYDNAASGLTATRYQTAIDELAAAAAAEAITSDVTYYVDGTAGSDSNDGLAWGTAKKTLSFLYSGDAAALPREIQADVVVRTKGTILSATDQRHTTLDGFYGSGSISIIGEVDDVVTGLTPTGYDNTIENTTYHSFIEVSGASWAVNAYKGDYIQFTTPASDELYPIMLNSATQLETIGLPDLAGTEVFKIVRLLTVFRASTVTDPITLLDYPLFGAIRSENCTLRLNLERVNVAKTTEINVNFVVVWGQDSAVSLKEDASIQGFSVSSSIKECTLWSIISLGPAPTFSSCSIGRVTADGYCMFFGGYGRSSFTLNRCVIRNDRSYIADGLSGQYAEVTYQLYDVRISNCETGIKLLSGKLSFGINLFIEDCKWGISARNAIVDLYYGAFRFRNNTEAINLVGGGVLRSCTEWCPIYSSGNTNDVVLWNVPSSGGLTFSQVNSRTPMSNALTGACVFYYDDVEGEWIMAPSEYDNTTSGLVATRYQTAIDELAVRSLESDLTLYVDGSAGDDANDGLSWGTAKATLGFLAEGEADALPREINATVVINVRGDVRARSASVPTMKLVGFYGSGSISIIGELVAEETFTASTYDNDVANQGSQLWVTDGTKAWTPDQWRRHFFDIGHSGLYPVRTNNGTTLFSATMRTITGTPTGTIYSAPEVLSELRSAPGVKYDFSYPGFLGINRCQIPISLTNLWLDEYRSWKTIPNFWDSSRINLNRISSGWLGASRCGYIRFEVCYINLTNGSFINIFEMEVVFWYTAIDSSDASGYGVYFNQNMMVRIYRTWMGNQITGWWASPTTQIVAYDGIYLQDVGDAIVLDSGAFYIEPQTANTSIRFDGVARAVVGVGDISKTEATQFLGWDVVAAIVFSDTDTGSLADFNSNSLENRSGIRICYLDADYMPVLLNEYNNTTSGLTATRYQTAIDELVADLADGPNYAQEVTVAKAGAQFEDVQDALDSITDAEPDKKYTVRIFPGIYDNEHVMKDNVDLVGIGPPRSIVLTSSSGTTVTMSNSGRSDLRNLTVERLSSVNDAHAVEVTAGTHLVYDCVLTQTSTDASGSTFHISGTGIVQLNTGQISLVQSGAAAGSGNINRCVHNEGSGLVLIRGINAYLELGDADDNAVAFDDDSSASGSVSWQNCFVDVNVTVAGFAGEAVAVCEHSNSVDKNVLTSRLRVRNSSGDPSGIGAAYRLDSDAGGARVLSAHNLIDVTGFASNYLGDIGTGDVLVSEFNAVDAVNGCIGAGSVLNEDGVKLLHGVVARSTDAGLNCLPTHITTTTFTLGATANPIPYFYNGIQCVVSADKTATLDDGAGGSTAGLYFVYFVRATGAIEATKTFPGFAEGANVLIAFVYWNGTNYGLVTDERHSYKRNQQWHEWAHYTVGARYYSGFDFVPTGSGATATFTMSGGDLYDEDIAFSAVASSSYPTPHTLRTWYQTGATTYTFDAVCGTTPFRAGAAGRPTYVNETGYVLTEASSAPNRYFNFFIYGVADMHTPVYCFAETLTASVAGTNGYTSAAAARAARFPALNAYGLSPELRPLYRLVVKANGDLEALIGEDDYRRVTTLPLAAGSTSTSASAVTFIPAGTIASTNVQLALEEVGAEKAPIASPTFTGTVSTPAAQITGDGSGSTHQVVNVMYGTGDPPSTAGIPYGTLYIKHEV